MCGIFGVIANEKSGLKSSDLSKIINTLFTLSESRGKESSGIAIKSFCLNKTGILKQSMPAQQLIKTAAYKKLFSDYISLSCASGILSSPLAVIAHTRLVTNGSQDDNNNNQPIYKRGATGVHNGILCNIENLWDEHKALDRKFEVDTELLVGLISSKLQEGNSVSTVLNDFYNEIEGTASTALMFDFSNDILLATNCGSLYILHDPKMDFVIFSSEKLILNDLVDANILPTAIDSSNIKWLKANQAAMIGLDTMKVEHFDYSKDNIKSINKTANPSTSKDFSIQKINKINIINSKSDDHYRGLLEYNFERISAIKRCTKCLLPATFPFISFDDKGVCTYCHSYEKIKFKGEDAFKSKLEEYKKKDGSPDCIVTLSGGRDSCFVLHKAVKDYGMTPIAYTYDWGMVTDLARRNQARMCGALGVEHIVISADITKKRRNIRKNVEAWLKRPRLGTIPLFMAGDKQYFYYANMLQKKYETPLVLMGENLLETTNFKSGFCGISPKFGTENTFTLSGKDKAKMLWYYGKEYTLNPRYLNVSMADTMHAFSTYYFLKKDNTNVFDYLEWDEKTVENVLFNEYNWELSPDTTTSWRIGDGTAAFYNYIYYNVVGFSEFDTFRSNQIREGYITRDEGLKFIEQENKPRYESLKWYLDTISVDFEKAIKIINSIPKQY